MVFGTDLVVLLFSARYAQSASLFRIFLLLLPLRITVYGSLLMAAGMSTVVLRAAAATLALNVALNLTLIPLLGMEGAAVSTVCATYAMAGWQLVRCARLLNVHMSEIFPWAALGRLMMVSACAAGVAWIGAHALPAGAARLAAGTILFTALAAPLLWYGGARNEISSLYGHRWRG